MRALFDIVIRKGWSLMTGRLLTLSKVIEQQLWDFEHPLRQFRELSRELLIKLERADLTLTRLRDMDAKEIGTMLEYYVLLDCHIPHTPYAICHSHAICPVALELCHYLETRRE